MATVTPDTWAPSVWSHDAVMDMQGRLDPVRMTRLADDWQHAVDRIREILVELASQVGATLEQSWQGRGADASVDAVRRYVAASLAGLPACRSAAVHLGELSTAAGELRAAVAPHDLDAALAHVRTLYSTPAVAAGNAVEDIPAPPDPFPPAGPAAAQTLPTAAPQTDNPMHALPPPAAAADPSDVAPPAPAQQSGPLATGAPAAGWRTPTHSTALSSPLDQPLPARADPPVATTSPPTTAAPPNASPGSPKLAPSAAPSSAFPFMGGMYPGHAGRDGGGEHRPPKYLISAGNSNELIGELPLVAPPVIGE